MLILSLMSVILFGVGVCNGKGLHSKSKGMPSILGAVLSLDATKLPVAQSTDQNTDSTFWLVTTNYDNASGSQCQGPPITEQWVSSAFCYPHGENGSFRFSCTSSKEETFLLFIVDLLIYCPDLFS